MGQSTPPTSSEPAGRPPSSATTNINIETSTSTGANYAFLVHSQDTLPRNLPPTVDNKPLARQKRRRTSPEDQAILEEEYHRNPKPDKAARMDIVNRVALGEKEVQIWFQNRRQNTRRKAKPLSPDELAYPTIDPAACQDTDIVTVPMASDTTYPGNSSLPIDNNKDETGSSVLLGVAINEQSGPVGNEHPLTSTATPTESSQAVTSLTTSQSSRIHIHSGSVMASSQGSVDTMATEVSELSSKAASQVKTKPDSHESNSLSNRRKSSYTSVSVNANSNKFPPRSESARKVDSFPSSKDASPPVRLRLSVDGEAQLVHEDDTLPRSKSGPPANSLQRSRGLQRSQSAIISNPNGPTANWPRRAGLSRAKTSRPWELYCDNDSKNGSRAEGHQSGSSATVTTQLKASNDTGLLRPNSNKRNAQTSGFEPSKRVKLNADGGSRLKKPGLVRSISSVPRLPTQSDGSKERPKKTKSNPTKGGLKPAPIGSPSGDSDKENWAPDDDGLVNGRRPTTMSHNPIRNRREQGKSQENAIVANEIGRSSEGNELKSTTQHSGSVNLSNERGREQNLGVASGSLNILNISRNEEDLDCVQNLLSLSQGNWR